MRATCVKIHLENLKNNIHQIQSILNKNTKICVPVKANAYGHGIIEIAKSVVSSGVDYLAVATVNEGIQLRESGIKCPILILSIPFIEEIPELVKQNLIPLVYEKEFIDTLDTAASKFHKKLEVHLKIDTGMGRIGCKPEDALDMAKLIDLKKNLELTGVCTHLAVSDSFSREDIEYTNKQISLFVTVTEDMKKQGINPGIRHCSASGGTLFYPDAHFDMVRPGLIVYGYFPTPDSKEKMNKKYPFFDLKPVMELKSKITGIKQITKGTSISYGRTWTAENDTWIATIPIGYGDGLSRSLSGKLSVTIKEKKYPVVGRICMDQCMIELGEDGNPEKHLISLFDEVTIFGPGKNMNTAVTLADALGTIPYEITTLIMPRVTRIYL